MSDNSLNEVKILIVEDDKFSCKIITETLSKIGVNQISTTENGQEAIDFLSKTETSIDFIICDIEMPIMDGYEFSRKIRLGQVPRFKSVPILILTGNDTEKNIEKAKFHRIEGFVIKPVTASELENKIRTILKISS
jgi:CheY-like chemotaxis protein